MRGFALHGLSEAAPSGWPRLYFVGLPLLWVLPISLIAGVISCTGDSGTQALPILSMLPDRRITAVENDMVSITDIVGVGGGAVVLVDGVGCSITLVDSAGTVVRRVGRCGAGPGEYRSLTTVVAGEGAMWVHDYERQRLLSFDSSGNLRRDSTFSLVRSGRNAGPTFVGPALRAVGPDGTLVVEVEVRSSEKSNEQGETALLQVSPAGMVLGVLKLLPSTGKVISSRSRDGAIVSTQVENPVAPLWSVSYDGTVATVEPTVASSTGGFLIICVTTAANDTVFTARVPYTGIPKSSSASDSAIERRARSFPPELAASYRTEARRFISPFFPPVRRMVFGTDKSLWIEVLSPEASRRWIALSEAGQLLGYLDVPRDHLLFSSSLTQLWFVQADSLGDETAIRYRLLLPTARQQF